MAKRDIPEINAGSMADIAFLLLIFFLVTTTMDKDTAYVRNIPKKLDVEIETPPVEARNICAIKANSKNQLMVRGKILQNPDEISEKIVEFYSKNEKLSTAQSNAAVGNPSHPGYNFPFYSRISMAKIDTELDKADQQLAAAEENPTVKPDFIEFKQKQLDLWQEKKDALVLYGKSELPEIHFQAHVRVEVQKGTEYKYFAKIQSEIEEALYILRDKASLDIFGESYGILKKRYAQDETPEDDAKLKLLEILYPTRIIEVKPTI